MKASDIDLISIPDAVDANADSYALIIENTELCKQQLKKLRYPRVLDQGGVPIYILPTGAVAANGAVTLGTALAVTESGGLWGYLPAGAAYAASAAGFYWVVMSSTTLGTIYGNTYVPGTTDWRIPATLVDIVDAGPGAYTGATTEVTAVSIVITGGSIGPNGSVTLRSSYQYNSSAGAKTIRTKFGGSTDMARPETTAVGSNVVRTIQNRGRMNSQRTPGTFVTDANTGSSTAGNTLSVDTSVDVIYALTMQLQTATDLVSLQMWAFETRYQP